MFPLIHLHKKHIPQECAVIFSSQGGTHSQCKQIEKKNNEKNLLFVTVTYYTAHILCASVLQRVWQSLVYAFACVYVVELFCITK